MNSHIETIREALYAMRLPMVEKIALLLRVAGGLGSVLTPEYETRLRHLQAKVADIDAVLDTLAPANDAMDAPVDDIEYIIARYFFQVERGQDERLDRINAWLDRVKPLEDAPQQPQSRQD